MLGRIRALAVPPAWTEVWLCTDEHGHLQASGVDAAGRRQYLYHDRWTQRRDRAKHDRMLDLAARLPRARADVAEALVLRGMPQERTLAVAFRLLDHGFFRVGSEAYRKAHGTFGLATLRRDQVVVRGRTVSFAYTGKGGIAHEQRLIDAELAAPVRTLLRRTDPHPELLAWKHGRIWHDLRSPMINGYLRELTGGDFTAKDFRTWNATVLMAQALAVSKDGPDTAAGRRRAVNRGVQEVAAYLGNTPAVARRSYIDPRIIECFEAGQTVPARVLDQSVGSPGLAVHGPLERAVVRLLERCRD